MFASGQENQISRSKNQDGKSKSKDAIRLRRIPHV
jgi:hypothetical protein